MDPKLVFTPQLVTLTRSQLLARGVTPARLAAEVRAGTLVRVRRGHYALPSTDAVTLQAVRIGGRVACVSAAAQLGIWVPKVLFPHVHLRREASRMRSPRNRFVRLTADNRDGCELHWSPLIDPLGAANHRVSVIDSLAQIVRCQPRPIAVAALDSALNIGLIVSSQLDRFFAALPSRFAGLRHDLNGLSMSGLESIVRLLAADAGLECELQKYFPEVGTVDLVIEGCVVVETDGRMFHDNTQSRDYRRDVILAGRNYTVLRFDFDLVMNHPDLVLEAILRAVANHRVHLLRQCCRLWT